MRKDTTIKGESKGLGELNITDARIKQTKYIYNLFIYNLQFV